jgi:head-tail adaptor
MKRTMPKQTDRRLVLEDPQEQEDGAGGHVESWTPLGVVWAEMQAQAGRTTAQEGGRLSLQRYRISLRAMPQGSRSRPRAGQRFRMGQRLFRIEAVSEADPEARYLTCQCLEELAP